MCGNEHQRAVRWKLVVVFWGILLMLLLSVEGVEANPGPLAEQDKIDQCCNTWHSRTERIK
jgi:hypothetical protein